MPIIVLGYDFADDDIGYEVRDDDVGSLLLSLQPGGHLQYSTVQYSTVQYSTVQYTIMWRFHSPGVGVGLVAVGAVEDVG